MSTDSRTNQNNTQYADLKASKETLRHLLMDLTMGLAAAGIGYGMIKLICGIIAS
jgi:hypothetical protein